jgi:CSLREA domain-containing protein
VPGSVLAPSTTTARFTATFRIKIDYRSKTSATATPVTGSFTFASRTGSTAPITATVEKLTNALRVLVVPMGDPSQPYASQYTVAGDAALQAAMLTLSRIYPIPEGVGSLTGTSGGLRYSVSPGMLDLPRLLQTTGRFCGTGGSSGNFNAIKASLGQFLQSWNAANGAANQADRVLGVVDAAISDGSQQGCAEGMAAINSNEAWIRAVPELPGVPSQSGLLAALELGHTFGLVLGGPAPTPDRDDLFSKYHSPNVYADPQRTNRSYNTRLRSVLVDDRTAMTYITAANNNNTLLEQLDWAYLICRLGGATSTECPAPAVPVGSGAGVAAGPRFVISGVTDGTVAGTKVLESFFSANMLPTPQSTASQYRLVFRNATGGILSNFGVPVQVEDSAHSHDDSGDEVGTALTLFSGAFDFPGTPNRIELWKGTPGSGLLLYARDRTLPPSITDVSVTPAGDGPANYTDDSLNTDFAPALSANGQWIAWAAYPSEGSGNTVVRVAPTDDVSQQARLSDGDDIDSTDPAWCSDGGRLAYVDPDDGGLWKIPVDTSSEPATFGSPTLIYDATLLGHFEASHPTWSPDCSQLAFEADDDIWRIDADGTDVVALTDDDNSHDPAWSPDSGDNRIAFVVFGFSGIDALMFAGSNDATYASFVRPSPDEPIGVLTHPGLHLVVNSTNDVVDGGGCDVTHCSLREAITLANATPNVGGPDAIEFEIVGSPPFLISPTAALPVITDPVEIDGTTQPESAAGAPVVVLDGTGAGVGALGLSITGGNSTIRGLVIANFAGNSAIAISGSGGNRIEACFIGTDVTGTAAAANSIGVRVSGSPNNVIGGTVGGVGNVISGNSSRNVVIESSGATGNLIAGNRIGTNADGTARLVATDQFHVGVQLVAADNTVGGTTAIERNLISGNGFGIQIAGSTTSGNDVLGNYIGTDATGMASISNERGGILVNDGNNNIIGGTVAGAGNVISGNSSGPPANLSGISISGSSTTANVVQGNLIGLAADGTTALPNKTGIEVNNAPANVIGGTVAGARNVISGNLGFGFNIGNPGATGTIIRGNYIGTDITGLLDRGNSVGINASSATGTIVGGSVAGAGNVISGNVHGVFANTGADGTVIRGNLIGTDAAGTGALGNSGNGVIIVASNVSVGGVLAADANVIANNGAAGVTVGTNTITPIGNRINRNSIDANGGLGIDLAPTGTNLNDADDSDTGVNGLQNFPVVTAATGDGVTTNIDGTLTSTADTSFRIEAFASDACDNSGSGHGEGARFLGAATVVANGSGTGSFTFSGIANADAPVGDFITTTATNQTSDNTSEFSACLVVSAPAVETATFTVNATDDTDDGLCGTVHCSLREAIIATNESPNDTTPDEIDFDINPDGAHTILVEDLLPTIIDPVIIDGTTQAGYDGEPVIEVDGSGTDSDTDGFVVAATGAGSSFLGLAVNAFSQDGFRINADDVTIEGSYIGVGLDGTTDRGNGARGVEINGGSGIHIGAVGETGTGNVISGNGGHGIAISAASPVTETIISGNLIGTNAAGTGALGNAVYGVFLGSNSKGTLVGGNSAAERNVISANFFGIIISGAGSDQNVVQGNYIGTDATGTADMGNVGQGIEILDATNNSIGGNALNPNVISGNGEGEVGADGVRIHGALSTGNVVSGNIIGLDASGDLSLGNTDDGVEISDDAVGNWIHGNSIDHNGDLGIELDPIEGVNPNDAGDSDTGANNLQNYPVVESAVADESSTLVTGTLTSLGDTNFSVDVYASDSCDPSGNGEGARHLGTDDVVTASDGTASFSLNGIPTTDAGVGDFITTTATDFLGSNTSEFSECFQVQEAGFGDEIHLLNPTTPLGTTTFVVDGFDPAWRAGSILYATDDELHQIQPDGTGDETITTGFADSSPSGGAGATAFVRTQGDDDIWLIVDGDTVNVTGTDLDSPPQNLRLDLFYVCGGQSMPIAVGLRDEQAAGTTANFQVNFDPSLSCGGGTIKASLTDGFLRTNSAGPGASVASDPKPPVAATYGPPLDSTYLTSDVIPFHGIGEDADDGTLTGTLLRWFIRPASAPCCGTAAGTGGSVDFAASGLTPGDYIVTLLATDTDGQSDSAESLIHILADSDHDGFSDAAETGSCFGAGAATNGGTPSADSDNDGLPNASDPEPCVAATVYNAIVDFNPNDLNLSSSGNPVTISIQTPGRDIRQIVGSSVRIVEASGAPTNLANMGWSVSGTTGTAKFARKPLIDFLKANGVTTGTVWIVVSGSSSTNPNTPPWSFTGRDTTNAKP